MLVHYEAICNRFVDRRKRARLLSDHGDFSELISCNHCDFDVRFCHAVSGSAFRLTPISKLLATVNIPQLVALFGGGFGVPTCLIEIDKAIELVDQCGSALISVLPGLLAIECGELGPIGGKSWHVLVRDLPVVERALQTLKGKRPK